MQDVEAPAKHTLMTVLRMSARACRALVRLCGSMLAVRSARPLVTYETHFQVNVPCHRDALSFRVTVTHTWTWPGDFSSLQLAVSERTQNRNVMVEQRLRAISRRFPPNATEEFERDAHLEVSRLPRLPEQPGLSCVISVHAALDEELCGQLREAEIERFKADAEYENKQQDVLHIEQMRDRWLAFLTQIDGHPLGPLAARLAARPGDLAEAIAKHATERERDTAELRQLCDTISDAYRDQNLFDFANRTDMAISRLLKHVGIDGTPKADGRRPTGPQHKANGFPATGSR
jgi:hypothetical protein